MKWSVGVIVVPLVLCLFVGIAHGIRCYQCNSDTNDPACGSNHVAESELKECTEMRYNLSASMCRKITQSVDKLINMEADERTVRTCGYVKPHKDSYYRAGFGSRQMVVTCYVDGCNTAPTTTLCLALVLSTIGATVANLL